VNHNLGKSHPLILFPAFVLSDIALSVLLTWIYNSTAGSCSWWFRSPLPTCPSPCCSNPSQSTRSIFTALLIITAAVVVGFTGPAYLSRTQRKQTSEDIRPVPNPVPAT
jgi:hypothetical protein